MIFGMIDAVKKDLKSQSPLHELIRGMNWKQAFKELEERGLTEYQIHLILESQPRKLIRSTGAKYEWVLSTKQDDKWLIDTEAVRNLRKLGLVDVTGGGSYILTETGSLFRETLLVIYVRGKDINSVDFNMDINLSRDGLLATCGKILWLLKNRSAIKEQQTRDFLDHLKTDTKELDQTLDLIATSEQRVARKLVEQGPPIIQSNWTEEKQRAQNDLYWMTDSLSAFWLNPHGLLADPTPAPEWWTPPERYESVVQKHVAQIVENDVVAKSLRAPEKPKKLTLDNVIEEIENLHNKPKTKAPSKELYYKGYATNHVEKYYENTKSGYLKNSG